MKILWVEDFGPPLSRSEIIEEIFGEFFAGIDLGVEFREEEGDTNAQLKSLFAQHTLHEIAVCESYVEWKDVYAQQQGDFDVVLIDIRLISSPTPVNERPRAINNSDFDEKAGFYIYHQLIKTGFPDTDIAFFTAEGQSLKQFSKYCSDMCFDQPANSFQKKRTDYQRLRRWLADKAKDPSLILRRGIIDGCRYMKQHIESIETAELESELIIFKSISGTVSNDAEALRRESIDYLTGLHRFFLLSRAHTQIDYYWFLKELSSKWEETKWFYLRHKAPPQFEDWLEELFHKTAHFQMKMLRNWSNHRLLSREIGPKEIAYFFMQAMRAWIRSDLNKPARYEEILASLFPSLSVNELRRLTNASLAFHLESSYEQLKALHKDLLRLAQEYLEDTGSGLRTNRRLDNPFLSLFREIGVLLDELEQKGRNERGKPIDPAVVVYWRRRIKEVSVPLFYQSFWHGLFPLQVTTVYYAGLQTVRFDIEPIEIPYLSFFGGAIFDECFVDREVSAKTA